MFFMMIIKMHLSLNVNLLMMKVTVTTHQWGGRLTALPVGCNLQISDSGSVGYHCLRTEMICCLCVIWGLWLLPHAWGQVHPHSATEPDSPLHQRSVEASAFPAA